MAKTRLTAAARECFLKSILDTRLKGSTPKIPDYKSAMRRLGSVGESLKTNSLHTFSNPTQVYTGTKMLGIATMHKSNSVPVFSEEEAKDISKMRRG